MKPLPCWKTASVVVGSYSMEEAAVVELNDGRVLMNGRTYLGQHFKSYSGDRGETWSEPETTGLTLVPLQCNVKRIPTIGDLLVVWNQGRAGNT